MIIDKLAKKNIDFCRNVHTLFISYSKRGLLLKILNKNKIIVFFILIFAFFSFSIKQKNVKVFAVTSTPSSSVTTSATSYYWKNLDFALVFNQDLSADITETHDVMFNQRLDGQPFQSLVDTINISHYGKLTNLKIYEKTKAGKLVEYTREAVDQKKNGSFFVAGADNAKELFSVRVFFDAKNEEKTFVFKYKLTEPKYQTNFVAFFSDYDNILLYPIPSSPNVFIQNLTMHLTLPVKATENDLYFWGLPQSTTYKTEIFANKISFTGILNKTDTNVGFDLLVKAGIFTKPADVTRKTTTILQNKISIYNPKSNQSVNPNSLSKSAAIIVGGLIALVAALYLFRVYLGISLKKISKKNKVFEDVDVLKYKNFKPYFSGMLLHRRVNKNDLTAMLIDLCTRGYLALRISRSKDANGKVVNLFILDKSEAEVKNDVLSNTERIFLNYLFKRGNSIYLTSLEDSYKSRASYFYSSVGKEILSYKLFVVPSFIHNLSLYKFLLKALFILLTILFLLLPSGYICLFLVPVFFIFFTNVLIMESPAGTKIKRDLIAFQAFCLNWKEKVDVTFVTRIPYFISLACFNSTIAVVAREKTLQDLEIAWLTIETAPVEAEEKTIAIEKKLEEDVTDGSIPNWNDLTLFLDKIRKTFGK